MRWKTESISAVDGRFFCWIEKLDEDRYFDQERHLKKWRWTVEELFTRKIPGTEGRTADDYTQTMLPVNDGYTTTLDSAKLLCGKAIEEAKGWTDE